MLSDIEIGLFWTDKIWNITLECPRIILDDNLYFIQFAQHITQTNE